MIFRRRFSPLRAKARISSALAPSASQSVSWPRSGGAEGCGHCGEQVAQGLTKLVAERRARGPPRLEVPGAVADVAMLVVVGLRVARDEPRQQALRARGSGC